LSWVSLTENFIVEEGRVFTDRLARYRVPSITQTPEIISLIVEHPSADGPYGAKGVGEIVSIPTTPAITTPSQCRRRSLIACRGLPDCSGLAEKV
jgi:CO/xanthine dehydrogenase Mo-binding subunit